MGAPQGGFQASRFTHSIPNGSVAWHSSNALNLAIIVQQITRNDESEKRTEIDQLINWCLNDNLALNICKPKKLIVDFIRGKPSIHQPVFINGWVAERFSFFKLLTVNISEDLSWHRYIDAIVKKIHQFLSKIEEIL